MFATELPSSISTMEPKSLNYLCADILFLYQVLLLFFSFFIHIKMVMIIIKDLCAFFLVPRFCIKFHCFFGC